MHPAYLDTPDLRPARVRVLFELPEDLCLFANAPRRLAYIEWFTALSKKDNLHHFHSTKPAWRSRITFIRRTAVIPLERIVRSVYLIPAFGRTCNLSWNEHNVLDECEKFYVNPWITTRTWSQLG
jgi:hypothetical protein